MRNVDGSTLSILSQVRICHGHDAGPFVISKFIPPLDLVIRMIPSAATLMQTHGHRKDGSHVLLANDGRHNDSFKGGNGGLERNALCHPSSTMLSSMIITSSLYLLGFSDHMLS